MSRRNDSRIEANAAVTALAEAEHLAEDILMEKQHIIDYDRRRNLNREAINAMKNGSLQKVRKIWVNFGDVFIELPKARTFDIVTTEQKELDKSIDDSRQDLKVKMEKLLELQGEQLSPGFKLKSLNNTDDINFING